MPKNRLNLSLDQDLIDFAKLFATENRTTVAEVITQYLLSLKRETEGAYPVQILAHPAFHRAMAELKVRLRDGSAEWQTIDEAFAE